MSGVECPRSDCIVPIGVPTESSVVAWLCLRRCHATAGSPSFFAAGFQVLAQEIPAIWRHSLACGKYQGFWINNGGTFAGENFCRLRPNRNGSRTALPFWVIGVAVVHRLRL